MTELLVALALSALLLLGLDKFVVHYRQTDKQVIQLFSEQEDFRFISHVLSREITTAGYVGCASLNDHFPVLTHTADIFTKANALEVLSANNNRLPQYLKNKAKLGTDIILIRKAALSGAVLQSSDGNVLVAGMSPRFLSGESILLSDCSHAEIFRVEKVIYSVTKQHQKIYLNVKPSFQYSKFSKIYPFLTEAFYLRKKGGLYQNINKKRTQELVSDVVDMAAKYQQRLARITVMLHHKTFDLSVPLREF